MPSAVRRGLGARTTTPGRLVDAAEARRIAVRAQLLDGSATSVIETVRHLGFLQIDPIATVAPAQHLVLWSRLGAYDVAELDRLLWDERALFEWDALLWPIEELPLVRGLMRRWRTSSHSHSERWVRTFVAENQSFRRYVLRELERHGPLLSRALEDRSRGERERHRWYGSRKVGLMLTSLHLRGEVAVAGRLGGQRLWDLAERVLPETEALSLRDAERALEERRFRALGVRRTRPGWEAHADATDGDVPERVTLLSPFDRLIHDRDRAEALFGFHYRLEMFVPRAKREYGYYVLPILRGAELVGRIEPVFDRRTPVLDRERRVGAAGRSCRRGARDPRGARGARVVAGSGVSGGGSAGAARLGGRASRLTRRPQEGRGSSHVPGTTIPSMHFETRAIHAGQAPDPATGAVTTPIYQTSTFAQEAVGVNKGYDYARGRQPDPHGARGVPRLARERRRTGTRSRPGSGATTTIMHLLDPGDHVVCVNDVYGGTYRMFSQVYEPKGYRFTYATPDELSSDPDAHVADARLVWIETPTNPLLNIVDIAAVAAAAKAAGRAPRRRQHVRDAVPPDAARSRRGHRHPLDDEVPRRPLGRHRRLRGDERPDDRRAPALPPEVTRRGARAVRLLARAARPEDARRPDGPTRARTRGRSSRSSRSTRASPACCGPAAPTTPGTRSQSARCATSAAWSRACSRRRRRRSSSSPTPRCGRSPRASAESRASSSIPPA